MGTAFDQLLVADGRIVSISIGNGRVDIYICTWQEYEYVIYFEDVIGIEGIDPVEEELSHCAELINDEFLNRCCTMLQENPNSYKCYAFFAAWGDLAILKVVARTYGVTKINSRQTT